MRSESFRTSFGSMRPNSSATRSRKARGSICVPSISNLRRNVESRGVHLTRKSAVHQEHSPCFRLLAKIIHRRERRERGAEENHKKYLNGKKRTPSAFSQKNCRK